MSGNNDESAAEYEIGYGKPPKEHQWNPGESGNRKGKPKGATSFAAEVRRLLKRKVPVKTNGKVRQITVLAANFERLLHKAMAGDTRAMMMIQELGRQYLPEEVRAFAELREDDRLIMARFLASRGIESEEGSDAAS